MKKLILLFFICFAFSLWTRVLADTPFNGFQPEQLLNKYRETTRDTQTVNLIQSIIPFYLERDLYNDSLMLWCNRSLQLSKALSYKRGLADSYYLQGRAFIKKQEHTHAFDSFFKALGVYNELNDQKGIAGAYMQMGVVSYVQKNYREAIKNFNDAIDVLRDADKKKSATLHYLKGLCLSESGNSSSGYEELKKAYLMKQMNGDSSGVSECRFAMADALSAMNKFDEAENYYQQSLNYFSSTFNSEGLVWVYNGLGIMFMKKGDFSRSKINLAKADSIATRLKNIFLKVKISKSYADLYEKTGDYEASLKNLKMYYSLKDSLFDSQNAKTIDMLRSQVEMEKQHAQIILLEQKRKTEHIYNIGLIIISSLLIVLAVGWYKRSKFKQAVNLKLESANSELQETLKSLKQAEEQVIQSEKMASLGRLSSGIAHELRNPLNFIQNFSQLSKESLTDLMVSENDEKDLIAADLSRSLDKIHLHGVRASEIINSMLKHSVQVQGETELLNLNNMVKQVLDIVSEDYSNRNPAVKIKININPDNTIPLLKFNSKNLFMLISNILENAFYAMYLNAELNKQNYPAEINIRTYCKEGKIFFSVKDNGGGIPADIESRIFEHFFTTKPPGKGAGLGLSICYDIVKSYGGNITFNNVPGKEVEFIVRVN